MTRFADAPGPAPTPLRGSDGLESPELKLGAKLLARVGPLPRSEQRRRRVWARLGATSTASGVRARASRLALAGVLLAAASSAALGYYWQQGRARPLITSPAPAQGSVQRSPGIPPARVSVGTPDPEPAVAGPEQVPSSPAPRTKADSRPNVVKTRPAEAEAEAQLLVEAMRARRDGNSKKVSELVDAYRAKHPKGALSEEALILAIESAVARRSSSTSALASEYLTRFPGGRFSAQARRAFGSR
jgi:hypothetical protein